MRAKRSITGLPTDERFSVWRFNCIPNKLCKQAVKRLATRSEACKLSPSSVYQVYALGMGPNYNNYTPYASFHAFSATWISSQNLVTVFNLGRLRHRFR